MFVVTLIALVGQEVERPLTCPLNLCDRTPFFSSYPIFSGTGIHRDPTLGSRSRPKAKNQNGETAAARCGGQASNVPPVHRSSTVFPTAFSTLLRINALLLRCRRPAAALLPAFQPACLPLFFISSASGSNATIGGDGDTRLPCLPRRTTAGDGGAFPLTSAFVSSGCQRHQSPLSVRQHHAHQLLHRPPETTTEESYHRDGVDRDDAESGRTAGCTGIRDDRESGDGATDRWLRIFVDGYACHRWRVHRQIRARADAACQRIDHHVAAAGEGL